MKTAKQTIWLNAAFLALVLLFAGCAKSADRSRQKIEITVSAAASLQDAFREIGFVCEKQSGVKVFFNFASSGVLQSQIEVGAPIDVFASAGKQQMDQLAAKDLIVPETRSDFARNELVLILPPKTSTPALSFVEHLAANEEKIVIGNPKSVPAGQYAEQTLRHLGIWEKLQPRLIFTEDVRQALDYVERREVGFGIVYASDSAIAKEKVYEVARAPENSHEPILYQIAVLKHNRSLNASNAFIKALLSPEGQQIMQKYEFQSVK